jgi:assimilatory nitrate reductase catalytic subunit
VAAPGETREDWAIAASFAQRLERRLRPAEASLFPYRDAHDVWNEHRESTRGRDLDITGLSYAALETAPAQWPWPQGAASGRARLYEDGIFPTPEGRANFVDAQYQPVAEQRDARFPYALNTGRLRDQWHGMSRTGTLGRLFGHVPEPAIEMNAQDMARQGLRDGDLVQVTSRRGSLVIPAQASAQQPPAQAFVAMHWGEEFLSGRANGEAVTGVNALTNPAFCPRSKQPELKNAAVKIAKAELPWRLLALAWLPEEEALSARESLRPLMGEFAFASCVPFGRERTGVLFRAAALQAPSSEVLLAIEECLGLGAFGVLHYADARRGQRRTMNLKGVGEASRLEGFLLAGDISAEAWVRPLLQQELPAQSFGRMLLVPGAKPPLALEPRGRQVCSCFNVSETEIVSSLERCSGSVESRLGELQSSLKCGTNCGSCLPELRRMVRASASLPASVSAETRPAPVLLKESR